MITLPSNKSTKLDKKLSRVVVYLQQSTVESINSQDKSKSVFLRDVIEEFFNPSEPCDPLSDAIRELAEKHYMAVAREQMPVPVEHADNIITIPESLRQGVKKYGYEDARKFIDDSIQHFANSLEQEQNNPVCRF